MDVKLYRVNEKLIERIVPELADALIQTAFREAIQLGDDRFILSFDGEEFRLLQIDLNPIEPAVYLIERKWRELKKNKMNTTKFVADLHKWFQGSIVSKIEKFEKNELKDLKHDKQEKFEKNEKREKREIKEVKAEKVEIDQVVVDPGRIPGPDPDPRFEQLIEAVAGLTKQVSQLSNQVEELKRKG